MTEIIEQIGIKEKEIETKIKKEKRNVPQLRFKGFEDEWEEKKASDIFLNISDKNHNGELDVLSVTQDRGVLLRKDLDIDIKFNLESVKNYKKVNAGDFIISLRSFQGGFEMSNQIGLISPAYTVFNFKDSSKFNSKYFSYIFKSNNFINKLSGLIYGVRDGKSISFNDFSVMKFRYPSLREQKKIADFLSLVDKKIEKQSEKVEALKTYKKGMMQKIFSQEIRFKNENGEEYPEWEDKKIGECFLERSSRGFENLELLAVSIKNGVSNRSDIDAKDNLSNDKSNYKLVEENDIVYNSMRMWQGASGVSKFKGIVSPAYTVLIPRDNIYSVYFGYLFKLDKMIYEFRKYSQGLTSDTWNLKYPQIKDIKIKRPCVQEQTRIANFLSEIDKKIEKEEKKLEELKTWKKGLLQKMFV